MRTLFFLIMVVTSNLSLGMQTDFVGPEDLLKNSPAIPESLAQQAKSWCNEHLDLCEYPTSLTMTSEVKSYVSSVNKSRYNLALPIPSGVVKLAGLSNILRETMSTLGKDPYSSGAIEELGGKEAILEQAKTIRRFQAVSAVAYYRLLHNLDSTILKFPGTFAYNISGKPAELDDKNYVIVQESLPPTVIALADLEEKERTEIINGLDVDGLYAVFKKAGLWNLHSKNLLIDPKNKQLWTSDLEKPNNEGYGESAKWKIAVFGKGDQSDHPWKWRHNIRTGHEEVAKILMVNPNKSEKWTALLKNDLDLKD